VGFLMQIEPETTISPEEIQVDFTQIDEILAMLRYWHGIEVDNWIDSEACKYILSVKVTGFLTKKLSLHLHKYFEKIADEYDSGLETTDLSDVRILFREDSRGNPGKDVLELSRVIESCRINCPVKDWLQFLTLPAYADCRIIISISFIPFGDENRKNEVILYLRVVNSEKLVITSFESSKGKFDYFGFLKHGMHIYRDIARRIEKKREDGTLVSFMNPDNPSFFRFPCDDEEEAFILNGLNTTIGIESSVNANTVEFKLSSELIPALLSYFWMGLPQSIFILPGEHIIPMRRTRG
jgi:hypothetical protein